MNDLGCRFLLNHTLSMPRDWKWRLCANYAVGARGGMWSIFYLILCEKNFLGLGAPACLLDMGVCHFDALVVDVGAFVDLGCPPSDPPSGISWGTEC